MAHTVNSQALVTADHHVFKSPGESGMAFNFYEVRSPSFYNVISGYYQQIKGVGYFLPDL